MFVLDTNVISELRKARAGKANRGVTEWAKKTPAALMFMSVISFLEIEHGVLLVERRDPAQGNLLRAWLDGSVVPAFQDRMLAVSADIARCAAAFHVPNPAPFRDGLIAATTQQHDMVLVTRNVRDFERFTEVKVTNPWN